MMPKPHDTHTAPDVPSAPSDAQIEAAAQTIAAVTGQGMITSRRRAKASSAARVSLLAECQETQNFRPAIAEIYGNASQS